MAIIQNTKNDHRWFIWTVLFLIVSGVSLVSYIMITSLNDTASADTGFIIYHHPDSTTKHK